jgi:hypothetical protein
LANNLPTVIDKNEQKENPRKAMKKPITVF